MLILLAGIFVGVLMTVVVQKTMSTDSNGNSQISIGGNSIQVQTVGKKVIINGPVESVIVNNKPLLSYNSKK